MFVPASKSPEKNPRPVITQKQNQAAPLSLPAVPVLANRQPVLQLGTGKSKKAKPVIIDIDVIDTAFRNKLDQWDQSGLPKGVTVLVYAAGSYGRKELQDNSDLDFFVRLQGEDPDPGIINNIRGHMGDTLPAGDNVWDIEYEGATEALLGKKNNSLIITGRLLWKTGEAAENPLNKYGGVDPALKSGNVTAELEDALTNGAKPVKQALYQPFFKGLIILGKNKGIASVDPYTIIKGLDKKDKNVLFDGYHSIETSENRKEAIRNVTSDEKNAIGLLINLLKA
jgi:hypothetical protein